MKRILLFKLFLMLLLCSFLATAGKKHCQDYRKKLDNIQSQQRQGHSNKRSQSLSAQENKARNTWWDCETGKLKPKAKKRKKSKKKTINKAQKIAPTRLAINQHAENSKPLVPYAIDSPIVEHTKYQDKKLQAWLQFYKAAQVCIRPKSMQQFAACAEDRRRQQAEFEKSY